MEMAPALESERDGGDEGIETLENAAVLTQEDLVAFQRLCKRFQELTESLQKEGRSLKDTPLKDYQNLPGLKGALGVTDSVCDECSRHLMTLTSHLGDLRKALTSVSTTLEEKLTAEGARSWVLETEPPEIDYAKQAEQKALQAQALQARTAANKSRTEITLLTEKTATLEAEAAQASVDSAHAAQEAEAAARRAEESRKAAELKAQADADAKRKEEEQRKKRELEEKRQKEEEEKRRKELATRALSPEEEEARRKEAERLDPNNWPMSVYSIDPGDLDIPIGCVVRSLPGSFSRDQLDVEPLSQLDDVLTLEDNEELVSHIITLIPTSGEKELMTEEPLAVAIPHCAPRNLSREVVVKKQMPNGQWVEIDSYDVTIDDIKEFKFVEVRLRELVPLVALTRYRKETFTLTRKGGKLSPAVDTRISLAAKCTTVRMPTDVTFEVQPVELTAVSDLKQRNPEVSENLLSSSPIVNLLIAIRKFTKPVSVSVPVPPPPTKAKPRPGTAAPSSSPEHRKDKSARNLQRPASAFFGLAHKKEEELEDALHLLTWEPNAKTWAKVPDVSFNQTKNKDVATFETPEYNLIKRFLILRTKIDATDSQVEKMAVALEASLKQRVVQMLLRQWAEDPQEVTLQCVNIQKSERIQRKLAEDGYGVGPPPSPEVFVHEGQKMTLNFRGNIKDTEEAHLQFVFNSHIKTKLDFSVVEIDRFAQKGINCYRGFAQVFVRDMVEQEVVNEDKQKSIVMVEGDVLLTEMLVSLPKPEPEPPKAIEKAPISIKGEGLINEKLLRHLAVELGDEWRRLAHYLSVRRVRIQAIMRNNVNKDQENAIYDMLMTWAKKVPYSCNKVDMLCYALGRAGRLDLVEDMRDREQDFKEDRAQYLRDAVLKKAFIKVAQNAHVTADWKFLARQLGIPETDLQVIERDHQGLRERCLQSLVRWRERAGTAATTDELLKYLRRCRYHHVIAQVKMVL